MGVDFFACGCCKGIVDDHACNFVRVLVYDRSYKREYGVLCLDCLEEYRDQFKNTGIYDTGKEYEDDNYEYRLIGEIPWYLKSISRSSRF